MHRYRPYSATAPSSRATPTTRCQKCLKLGMSRHNNAAPAAYPLPGHYSYDCKATTQDRPYVSRPSRTQQLRDPKLLTKLTEAAPPDDKKGLADSILKAKEDERKTRKRTRDGYERAQCLFGSCLQDRTETRTID